MRPRSLNTCKARVTWCINVTECGKKVGNDSGSECVLQWYSGAAESHATRGMDIDAMDVTECGGTE